MTLTAAHTAILEAPFRLNEHRFKAGQVYILKSAIRHRLTKVDPNWSEGKPDVIARDADTVTIALPLTVAGTTRYGVGVGIINRWTKEGVEIVGYDLALAAWRAIKAGATDAVARAALEFGVGEYLKDKPSDVKQAGFETWLAKLPPPPDVHWAFNGGGQRVTAFLDKLTIKWEDIKDAVEPGKTLARLSETTLTEAEFMVCVVKILTTPAQPKVGTSELAVTTPPEAAIVSH